MDIEEMTVNGIKQGYKDKSFTVEEVVKAYLKRINDRDRYVGAFISVCNERALAAAKRLDKRLQKGEDIGPLGGVPIAIKDNVCTKGIRTTCATKVLENFIPAYDATIVKRLNDAGAIIIGKTNMDELAIGSDTLSSPFKTTRNPWDLSCVPGGSSGGSAAAIATDFAPLSIGSDTGGSVRQPASYCGLVGLKPTYGVISRYGLISYASSLDNVGSFSLNVKDGALLFDVLKGYDPLDSTSVRVDLDSPVLGNNSEKRIKGLKVGIPKECFIAELDTEVKDSFNNIISVFKDLGARVEEISLPIFEPGVAAYYIITAAEASSNFARYDGILYGYRTQDYKDTNELVIKSRTESFGLNVKKRIMLGTYILSSGNYDKYYSKAADIRKLIRKKYQDAFKTCDIILMPTSPILPYKIDEGLRDDVGMKSLDIYTVTMNLAGIPAISLPSGLSKSGLPIGVQLVGNYCSESLLFTTAYSIEQAVDFHYKPFWTGSDQYV